MAKVLLFRVFRVFRGLYCRFRVDSGEKEDPNGRLFEGVGKHHSRGECTSRSERTEHRSVT